MHDIETRGGAAQVLPTPKPHRRQDALITNDSQGAVIEPTGPQMFFNSAILREVYNRLRRAQSSFSPKARVIASK